MNVVDSSGWLEYFGKGPNGEFFAPAIRASDQLVVPTISMYEVYKRIVLQRDEEEALSATGWMAVGRVVDLTREYGIPAVLGTGVATRRILSGDTITVDGSVGTVTLPNDGASSE